MSQSIPFEIAALILAKLLKHNPGTYVVLCQMLPMYPVFTEEYNTLSSALEKYNDCTSRGASAAIYERHGDRFIWLSPYLNVTFPQFIDNVQTMLQQAANW